MLEGDPPFSNYEPYEAAKYVADGHRPVFRKSHTNELKEYVLSQKILDTLTIAMLTWMLQYFNLFFLFLIAVWLSYVGLGISVWDHLSWRSSRGLRSSRSIIRTRTTGICSSSSAYIIIYSLLQLVSWMGFSREIWHWWMYRIRCLEKGPMRLQNFLAVLRRCYFC